MKRLYIILVISFISFTANMALADDSWSVRWSSLVSRAKQEAKKIEVKIKTWADSLFVAKPEERKPTSITETQPQSQSQPKSVPAPEVVDRGTSAKDIQNITQKLKSDKAITKIAGREGDKNLKHNKSGVVVIPVVKKHIDRLDIGTEDRISANDILGDKISFKPVVLKPFKALASPDVFDKKVTNAAIPKKIEPANDAKDIVSKIKSPDFPVTKEKIDRVTYVLNEPKVVIEKEIRNLNAADLVMVASYLINGNSKSCHTALGLLQEINDQSHLYPEAQYIAGTCARDMGLHTQFVNDMKTILKLSDAEYGKLALSAITENVKFSYEDEVANSVRKNAEKFGPTDKAHDAVHFLYAKVAAHEGEYQSALSEAKKVGLQSSYYGRAQFIVFATQMVLGDPKEGLETAKALLGYLNKKGDPDKLEPLIHLNMARGFYNNKQYTEASQSFLKIKKDHPQWIQGLIEQGWAQLQSKDPSGAIGNMFSIQTNMFNNTYKPDSFVVRTIGYLNICQYGDAYRSVELFDRIHSGWLTKIGEYQTANKRPQKYYDTVKHHLQNPQLALIDGLPIQVVREMARHRDFLNAQNAVNELVDEQEQWTFLEGFFAKDMNRISGKINGLKSDIRHLTQRLDGSKKQKATPISPMEMAEMKSQLVAMETREKNLEFRLEIVKRAQANFHALKKSGIAFVVAKKDQMHTVAEKALFKRLKLIKDELNEIIANNELLKYEVFSGSGENIRFQVAGGQKGDLQKPKHIKDNSKNMNWEYDGEIWEDEIGNFRSSLENNCPKENSKSAKL